MKAMSSTQVGNRDLSEIFPDCRRQYALVNQIGHTIEQLMLLDHIRRLEQEARANIISQCNDIAFIFSGMTSRISGSSIAASLPCGRRISASCGR